MAKVTVPYHPELTVQRVIEVFRSHFAGKYDVYKTRLWPRGFVVKKSGWSAIGIRLKHEPYATTFLFMSFTPSPIVLFFLTGIPIHYLLLRSTWKAMEQEVRSLIENASEFH